MAIVIIAVIFSISILTTIKTNYHSINRTLLILLPLIFLVLFLLLVLLFVLLRIFL